jgi:alpha-D-ribose 1-methylphosphonate 5-triphosphate diphosphatase
MEASSKLKRIINVHVIGPEKVLKHHQIIIRENMIEAIIPLDFELEQEYADAHVIDGCAGFIAPGMIDIHSDYIEHMAAPRPTSMMDFHTAIREMERELISHGITTMYHSLSFYNSTDFPDKPIRNPENTRRFIDHIQGYEEKERQIHHRFHARFEIDSHHRRDELEDYLRDGKIHLLSFMDHTPGQGQYRDLSMFKKTMKGYRNVSDSEIDVIIAKSQAKEKLTWKDMEALAEIAQASGVALASHDDDSVEKLDLNKQLGMAISEFPVSIHVAEQAKMRGFHTVAGAPNVLLGGSHSGNLSASEAIQEGVVDILCSDYYPPAMLQSVFKLYAMFDFELSELFRLVTLHPAQAVGIDDEYGSIEIGKKADLIIIQHLADGYPVVSKTLVDGEECFSSFYRKASHRKASYRNVINRSAKNA